MKQRQGRIINRGRAMQWSGQVADREYIIRQAGSKRQAANGQSRENSPGNNREMH